MKKLVAVVCLVLILPVLFSDERRASSPVPLAAMACEPESVGNFCDAERTPSRHSKTGATGTPGKPVSGWGSADFWTAIDVLALALVGSGLRL